MVRCTLSVIIACIHCSRCARVLHRCFLLKYLLGCSCSAYNRACITNFSRHHYATGDCILIVYWVVVINLLIFLLLLLFWHLCKFLSKLNKLTAAHSSSIRLVSNIRSEFSSQGLHLIFSNWIVALSWLISWTDIKSFNCLWRLGSPLFCHYLVRIHSGWWIVLWGIVVNMVKI